MHGYVTTQCYGTKIKHYMADLLTWNRDGLGNRLSTGKTN